jgi:hypothetical protein
MIPASIDELLLRHQGLAPDMVEDPSNARFKEQPTGGASSAAGPIIYNGGRRHGGVLEGDFVRFEAVRRLQIRANRQTTTINNVPSFGGPGGDTNPLWVLPRTPKPKKSSVDGGAGKLTKFEGVIFEWTPPDKVCTQGKPPEPRRSFSLTGPLADGHTMVLFGGVGLDGGPPGRKNAIPGVLIAGNIRLEEKIYNTTNLLVSMAGLPKETFAAAGIGTSGTSCENPNPVPTPPSIEPEEPMRPTN